MCGRYTLRTSKQRLEEAMQAGFEQFSEIRLVPRFNVKPGTEVLVVRRKGDRPVIGTAAWGFVPVWSRDEHPKIKPVNAMSETVAEKSMFRSAFKSGRCLMPADGFYEPKGAKGAKRRPQFFFHRPDDQPFAFAAIEGRGSCCLLTTTPNKVVGAVHDRMPVILHADDFDAWLDPDADSDELNELLRPYPADELIGHEVSLTVNQKDADGPKLIEPVTKME